MPIKRFEHQASKSFNWKLEKKRPSPKIKLVVHNLEILILSSPTLERENDKRKTL